MADCCAMMRPCFPTILACNAKNFKGNLSIFCEGDQLEENIQYSRTIKFSRVVEDESHENQERDKRGRCIRPDTCLCHSGYRNAD